jgi:tRNA (cytidine/uridine-2'-O-)-methyltransferase
MRVTPTAHVVLVAPEIAGNTGNVIRLCANTGSELHLVEPLGFVLDDARMKRAGLDYHERTSVRVHTSFETFLTVVAQPFVAFTARGTTRYDQLDPALAATMVFGCEASGLPDDVPNNRSLNLANTVAITVFDRWRQLEFPAGVQPERGLAVEGLELVPPDF